MAYPKAGIHFLGPCASPTRITDMSTLNEGRNFDAAWASRLARVLQAHGDQLLVLVGLIAIWHAVSLVYGAYWIGSPFGVLTRFVAASPAAICCVTPPTRRAKRSRDS